MRAVCILTTFLLLLAAPAQGNEVAERLQEKYASIDSMRAEFTQVLVHKESRTRENRNGVLGFKKPLLVRWEVKKPSPELLVVGKDVIWNAFPEEEIAYKYALDLAQDSRSIIRVVTGQARLDQDFFIEEEGREEGLARLRLYPKEPTQSLVEAVFWVDPKSGLIKKLCIYDFYGNENEITFTKLDTAAKWGDADFTYAPPKNFEVEDMTKESGSGSQPMKPLMR